MSRNVAWPSGSHLFLIESRRGGHVEMLLPSTRYLLIFETNALCSLKKYLCVVGRDWLQVSLLL